MLALFVAKGNRRGKYFVKYRNLETKAKKSKSDILEGDDGEGRL